MTTSTASGTGTIGAKIRSQRHGSYRLRHDLLLATLKRDRSARRVMECDPRRAAFDELFERYRYEIS